MRQVEELGTDDEDFDSVVKGKTRATRNMTGEENQSLDLSFEIKINFFSSPFCNIAVKL